MSGALGAGGGGAIGGARFCRLCAAALDAGVMIFGARGHHMMLRDSISNYLRIEINLDDKLPKMVCISCCTQINSIRVFAEMAYQSQYTLSKQLEVEDLIDKEVENDILLNSSNHDENEQTLMKEENSDDDRSMSEDDTDVTEMEVRLDPMMFLDSHTDDSQTNDSKKFDSDTNLPPDDVDCATLTKIDDRSQSLSIELVRYSGKQQFDKKLRMMPDLKPIKPTRKFVPTDGVRPYVCTYCPRSFFSSIALQNHSWMHSNKQEAEISICGTKIKCPICRKEISKKTNLKVHMESHKEKYNCDICGRVFKTQSNLFRHKEYHGGEVFTCGVCGRVYPTNSTLRAHSVTHSDARPHNCPLCKKTFKRNQDLKFHINQHTGERPYRCPYCPKAFASSGNCFSHRKRMHPAEVERDREKAAI